jgi:DNA polymerase-3 subunit epsilon
VLGGHVFVAHNARFDWAFVSAEVERATGRTLDGPRLCTVKLARKLLPQLRRRSLDYVAMHYGVEIQSRHRVAATPRRRRPRRRPARPQPVTHDTTA